jgi:hypothetical protein
MEVLPVRVSSMLFNRIQRRWTIEEGQLQSLELRRLQAGCSDDLHDLVISLQRARADIVPLIR